VIAAGGLPNLTAGGEVMLADGRDHENPFICMPFPKVQKQLELVGDMPRLVPRAVVARGRGACDRCGGFMERWSWGGGLRLTAGNEGREEGWA
jgi:hypothetical protein